MIDFDIDPKIEQLRQMIHWFAENEVRPAAIEADRNGGVSREFVEKVLALGVSAGGVPKEFGGEGDGIGEKKDKGGLKIAGRLSVVGAEEMAWGDPGCILAFPGPGLGGPPVAITGTPEQKKRFFAPFKDLSKPSWGAYATTEPGCGSDVAAMQT